VIAFERSTDGRDIAILKIQPSVRSMNPDPWELWRHRHAYTYHWECGYSWNAMDDERHSMSFEDGAFYDDVLQRLWLYWAQERLGAALTPSATPVPTGPAASGQLFLPVDISWDDSGVLGSAPIAFTIRLWGVPVRIDFEVSKDPAGDGRVLIVRDGYRWKYDRQEWRHLHGYEKGFWGGYSWLEGFPADSPLSENDGRRLDELLDKSVSHWVAAAVNGLVADLDRKVRDAMKASH
jgi:hypothetical protein